MYASTEGSDGSAEEVDAAYCDGKKRNWCTGSEQCTWNGLDKTNAYCMVVSPCENLTKKQCGRGLDSGVQCLWQKAKYRFEGEGKEKVRTDDVLEQARCWQGDTIP